MKYRDIIGKMRLVAIMGLMGLMGLMGGCSNEETELPRQSAQVELMSYVSHYTDAETVTRSHPSWAPDGYDLYDDLVGTSGLLSSNTNAAIGAFFTRNGYEPLARKFSYGYDNKWHIDEEVTTAGTYQIYGYVPYDAATATITGYDNTNGTYTTGAKLTLTNLSSVMSKDVCVIVGAKHGTDASTVVGTLTPGDFACGISGDENYLFLLFDHLYAALRFRFRLDSKYAELRTIKLRKLELMAFTDEACRYPMKSKQSTTITLRTNATGDNPIVGDVTFTVDEESAPMNWVLIYNSEVELPSAVGEYTDNLGFVPKTSSFYLLRSTYDVYDTEGNLIRKGCTAENKVDPRKNFNQDALDRGYIYTLRLTVKPTYLYVLSDPDLDNPEVTIN